MAKAEHLGGDRYRVRAWDQVQQRQRSRTYRAASQSAANRRRASEEKKLRDEIDGRRAEAGTVKQLAERWLRHRTNQGDSPTTLRRTSGIVDRIIADLGGIQVDDLGSLEVDEWLDKLRAEGGRSESTLHHYFRVLRSMLRQGRRWGMVTEVVTERATAPKAARPKVRPPSVELLGQILADCTPHLRFAAALAARTGLRRGELIGLRWSDVVPGPPPMLLVRAKDGNVVDVGRQVRKGLKSEHSARLLDDRQVVLDHATLRALDVHRRHLEETAVELGGVLAHDAAILPDLMTDPTGRTPRRPGWLTLAWSRACARHGVRVRFHDLRHFHATLLLDRGLSLAEVADRVGHAQVTTTANTYVHGTESGRMRAAEIAGELAL